MSSNRRIQSSRANGALSRGPITPLGKQHSSLNAIRHGLLADCVLLQTEPLENFSIVHDQHLERFQPSDGVELGMIEEMTSACWRMRRAWSIETRLMDNLVSKEKPEGDELDRMTKGFAGPEGGPPNLALLHRYETRLHLMYRRSMQTMLLLKALNRQIEPNPDSEHQDALPAPPQRPAIAPPDPVENA